MHGLPDDTDLSSFAGSELIQVAFGEHQVQLAFHAASHEQLKISIESEYAVSANGSKQRFDRATAGAAPLLSLLGASVTSAAGQADSTVVVTFADGRTLEIYEDDGPFESYQINIGQRIIVV